MPPIVNIKLSLKTVKLTFVLLCFLLGVVFVLTVFSFNLDVPRLKSIIGLRSDSICGKDYPPWLCDAIPKTTHRHAPRRRPEVTQITLYSTEVCPGLEVAFPLKETETFQLVEDTNTYIYSAFYDDNVIRIIAIRHQNDSSKLYCHTWSDTIAEDPLHLDDAHLWDLPESHKREYTPVYIECPLPQRFANHPHLAVSLSSRKCGQTTSVVPVVKSGPMTSEFIVCVPALKYEFDDTHALVESIEFKRLLGASKLVFYNYSVGESVNKVLHHYKRHGVVDVHQWHLPMGVMGPYGPPVHTAAQLAVNNDCIYRNRFSTRYAVIQDVDEFIVPTGDLYDWSQLVQKRLRATPGANTFQVRNVFFRKEWIRLDKDFVANVDAVRYRSVVLQHVFRENRIFEHSYRSKCIVNPRKVHTVGIHNVWETITGDVDEVPKNDALVFHYRKLHKAKHINTIKDKVRQTTVVSKYGLELIKRLKKAWESIEEDTGLRFDRVKADCAFVTC